ncbi:hexokinase 2 (HXK) [Monocercomonoides exilis]|uniref:hexokinase 2 (HXK) n=1 Tax=Monocercomonoides exilis TaxID=2049356 RepID=UPI0035597E23|nr:hexokinase 2 (HXK) [Monocercomonoides exilis]|eukprot:MONOS_7734.1-p1 / transcript=MONOS_7734.1 / gene=MONOS_7734 / organism=Monocercomonoides_exilis_PA203 / gene_product=hexokinase 2 (HXK) / transcript_product=hexokinase 2 (HXK) / location=Mono_scaffold00272:38054-39747(-) / protein_length=515 / sequence_SO=supercontig / SO=protein_coding / is_pseudo=false
MESLIQQFNIDVRAVQPILFTMLEHMHTGLQGPSHSMLMIPTFTDVPSKPVNGLYLALDFGGTNFRCLLLNIKHNEILDSWSDSRKIDPQIPTSKELMSVLGGFIQDFLHLHEKELTPRPDILYTGYTFSFPTEQTSLNSGTLVHWTKEFITKGCVGEDPVKQLQEELNKRNLDWVKIIAMCNDTVGTLCTRRLTDPSVEIGVILGTGSNASYREKISNIKKLDPKAIYSSDHMLINMEWGSFSGMPQNEFDKIIFEKTKEHSSQPFEKQISGRYLPMMAREALRKAILTGCVFNGLWGDGSTLSDEEKSPFSDIHREMWDEKHRLRGEEMEEIIWDESEKKEKVEEILRQLWCKSNPRLKLREGVTLQLSDLSLVQQLFKAILTRSARLSAIAVSAVVIHIVKGFIEEAKEKGRSETDYLAKHPKITAAIDGSLFTHNRGYKEEMARSVELCLDSVKGYCLTSSSSSSSSATPSSSTETSVSFSFPSIIPEVVLEATNDGSGIGAAVIVAANS